MWKLASLLLLFLACSPAWSAPNRTSTDFSRWLNDKAAPALAEKLARHPKFKGSSVAFSPAHLNQLMAAKNQLYQDIEQVLTHNILSAGRNNIVSATTSSTCLRPEHNAQYIIGIAINATNSSEHTVQIKLLDHDLGVWVSGISYRWRGQLSRAQLTLLKRPANTIANGSVAAPYAHNQQPQTVSHLLQQIQCALPAGVDGLVYLRADSAAGAEGAAASIIRDVRQKLSTRPQWIFTTERSEAAWLMELHQEQASQQLPPQWVILLTQVDKPKAPRIVASSYIESGKKQLTPTANNTQPLLGQLSWKRSRSCTNRNRDCVEIKVDLQADAYVMLFRTHNRKLKPASCDTTTPIRKRGVLSYQISLPAHSPLPTGVYAVASTDKTAFNLLRTTMQMAPGACQGSNSPASSWLTSAAQSIDIRDGFDWQSLHLQKVSGRLSEIKEAR
jgi:hypothetical protein